MDVNSSDSEEIVQMDVLEAGDVPATAPDSKKLRLSKEMEVCGVIGRLMMNIVDYLGASTLTRKRMDLTATSNLTGKVGCNIHQDKLNEIFVKHVGDH